MARKQSVYMCQRCGCAVHFWDGWGADGKKGGVWKHSAGPGMKSCGKEPHVIERAKYEASIKDMLASAKDYEERSRKNGPHR